MGQCWNSIKRNIIENRIKLAIRCAALVIASIVLSFIIGITIVRYKYSSDFKFQTIIDEYGYFNTSFTKDQFEIVMTDDNLKNYNKFWGPKDYVMETDDHVLEIFTNYAIFNVTLGNCAENPQYEVACDPNTHLPCKDGKQSPNGVQTGKCVPIEIPKGHVHNSSHWNVCEVQGWCPTAVYPPLKVNAGAILDKTEDTHLSIQSFIQFPIYGVGYEIGKYKVPNCRYDNVINKYCPYFRLEDIVNYASGNTKTYLEIARDSGGIFEIKIYWDCVLHEDCMPQFTFSRKDNENALPPPLYSKVYEIYTDRLVILYGRKLTIYVITEGRIRRKDYPQYFLYFFAYSNITLVLVLVKIIFDIWMNVNRGNAGNPVNARDVLNAEDEENDDDEQHLLNK